MLTDINLKLLMGNRVITKEFYVNKLGCKVYKSTDFVDYLMHAKDQIQIHFFGFETLNSKENCRPVYIRTKSLVAFYESLLNCKTTISENGPLETKPRDKGNLPYMTQIVMC